MGSIKDRNKRTERYGIPRNNVKYLNSLKCKRFNGSIIINENGYALDQISENDNIWFYHKSEYLMKTYGIRIEDYYRIVIYGSSSYFPVCKYCGKDCQFRSLRDGYYMSCCSRECTGVIKRENALINFNTPEAKKKSSKSISKFNRERWDNFSEEERNEFIKTWGSNPNRDRKGPHLSNTIKIVRNSSNDISKSIVNKLLFDIIEHNVVKDFSFKARAGYLSRGEPNDECYFYIAVNSKGLFKFGVTRDIEYRLNHWRDPYRKIKPLFKSTRIFVANLEFLIKLDLKIIRESIEWNRVEEFRKSYIKNYKLLIENPDLTIQDIISKFNDYP